MTSVAKTIHTTVSSNTVFLGANTQHVLAECSLTLWTYTQLLRTIPLTHIVLNRKVMKVIACAVTSIFFCKRLEIQDASF